jgi:hypothetical protein
LLLEPLAHVALAQPGRVRQLRRRTRSALGERAVQAEPVADVDGQDVPRSDRRVEQPLPARPGVHPRSCAKSDRRAPAASTSDATRWQRWLQDRRFRARISRAQRGQTKCSLRTSFERTGCARGDFRTRTRAAAGWMSREVQVVVRGQPEWQPLGVLRGRRCISGSAERCMLHDRAVVAIGVCSSVMDAWLSRASPELWRRCRRSFSRRMRDRLPGCPAAAVSTAIGFSQCRACWTPTLHGRPVRASELFARAHGSARTSRLCLLARCRSPGNAAVSEPFGSKLPRTSGSRLARTDGDA